MKKLIVLLCCVSLKAGAGKSPCESAFPSGWYFVEQAKSKAVKDKDLHPSFVHPEKDHALSKKWDQKPENVPPIFNAVLPEGVSYISHQQFRPDSPFHVKLDFGGVIMARASYEHRGRVLSTNVAFGSRAILSNAQGGEKKYLVGSDAEAAVLVLHGMGMQTTGAHTAKNIIQDFNSYKKVDVLAFDLPWHAGGHREIFKYLEEEVVVLSAFAKKYIPPHVPLFVLGHSGGTVFVQKLMAMTDIYGQFFHPNLQGVLLFSPVVSAAPGKSAREQYEAFSSAQKKGIAEAGRGRSVVGESLFEYQKFDDISPFAELYGMWNIVQMSETPRGHIPTLMAVGTKDPLVFTGFPKEGFEYFDRLKNVETHYLEKLPLLRDKNKTEEVGHSLGEYMDPHTKLPVILSLSKQFIEKHLSITLERAPSNFPAFVQVVREFANNLAFREFLLRHRFLKVKVEPLVRSLERVAHENMENEVGKLLDGIIADKKHQNEILKALRLKNSAEQALEFLNSESLPQDVRAKIANYISHTEYYTIKQIRRGEYHPHSNNLYHSLLNRGFFTVENRHRAALYIQELSQNIESRSVLNKEIKDLQEQQQEMKKKHREAFDAVKKEIQVIKQGIKLAEPPASLKEDFLSLKERLKSVKQEGEKIISMFEEAGVKLAEKEPSLPLLNDILKQYEPQIHEFNRLYDQYDLHRRNLLEQLIIAFGKGEMGLEYQRAVQNIYGSAPGARLNLKGQSFLKWDNINKEWARVESQIYNKKALSNKLLMEYQNMFAELFSFVHPVKEGRPDWIELARRAYTFENMSVYDILKPMDLYNVNPKTAFGNIDRRIIDNMHFFEEALAVWRQFESGKNHLLKNEAVDPLSIVLSK